MDITTWDTRRTMAPLEKKGELVAAEPRNQANPSSKPGTELNGDELSPWQRSRGNYTHGSPFGH
jgi:hypothetical protein